MALFDQFPSFEYRKVETIFFEERKHLEAKMCDNTRVLLGDIVSIDGIFFFVVELYDGIVLCGSPHKFPSSLLQNAIFGHHNMIHEFFLDV